MISSVKIFACGFLNKESFLRIKKVDHPSGLIRENTETIGDIKNNDLPS